jgi:hypothetical protein
MVVRGVRSFEATCPCRYVEVVVVPVLLLVLFCSRCSPQLPLPFQCLR